MNVQDKIASAPFVETVSLCCRSGEVAARYVAKATFLPTAGIPAAVGHGPTDIAALFDLRVKIEEAMAARSVAMYRTASDLTDTIIALRAIHMPAPSHDSGEVG